jgi:catechol 2,3-dioxygenase-like lactoylglutathione lyase family enzyme
MTQFHQACFFIHVPVFAEGVSFFCDVLGFRQTYLQGNYTYLERDGVAVRLIGYDGADIPPQRGDRRFCYYVDVADVEKSDVLGPVTQPYGQRELMIIAPDNNLIVFGEGKFVPDQAKITKPDQLENGDAHGLQ